MNVLQNNYSMRRSRSNQRLWELNVVIQMVVLSAIAALTQNLILPSYILFSHCFYNIFLKQYKTFLIVKMLKHSYKGKYVLVIYKHGIML